MINPNDVNLIIFDLDGTIVMSQPLVYEAVQRCFKKLGWPVTIRPGDINQFIGNSTATTGGSLYEYINPPFSPFTPDEMRDKVRAEYPAIFRETALTFPGVKETLAELRRRGYKLAQYTNASTMYLNTVMSSLDLRSYYDYIECIEDNKLNKDQLVKKIREHFGGIQAAVVGDRHHDIESARVNGALSIGAQYGYGGEEPEEADLTIKQFSDLLKIFDRRKPVFEKIFDEITGRRLKEMPFVIGVNGIDCSGKTTFANDLEAYLKAKGLKTQTIHMDDFHNPSAVRYAGNDLAYNYYHKSFNISLIIEKLLKPLRENGQIEARLTHLDLVTDEFNLSRQYSITPETIVIFEGVFLFRKELAPFIDYKVYLDITPEESKRRADARDSAEMTSKYDTKYLPAQAKYIKECSPADMADMVIDNTDTGYPKLRI